MPTRPPWVPTIVRRCELGSIIRWDEQPPEAPHVSYSVWRRADKARVVMPTYQEAISFLEDRHCPVLDIYPNVTTKELHRDQHQVRSEDREEQPADH